MFHETSIYTLRARFPPSSFRRIKIIQIDVMVIYSKQARESRGTDTTAAQMATIVTEAVATTNEAFANTAIDLRYRIVHVDQVLEQNYGEEYNVAQGQYFGGYKP